MMEKRENGRMLKSIARITKQNFRGEGWRMPTREELLTIVDLERYNPAADPIFNAKSEWYWSSTPCAFDSGGAWCVGFYFGGVGWYGVDGGYLVRPVRQNS